MSSEQEPITSQARLIEIFDKLGCSTWDMYDTYDIMCGMGSTYYSIDLSYMQTARLFDPKIPDSFFATSKMAEVNAKTAEDSLTREDGESEHDFEHRKAMTRINTYRDTLLNEENFWVYRECYRSWHGQYTHVEFLKHIHKSGKFKREYMYHFPHVSVEDPTMMAYTPSHEYGKRDRQVRLRIGKYLQKYYGDVLSSEEIRMFANGAKNYELKFGTTKEDFRRIYRLGPQSCMANRQKTWDSADGDFHPVDVYEGEFKLAYLEPIQNTIIARAFVHQPTKRWVRAYGDEADTLIGLIQRAGYTKAHDWDGARLKYITDDSGKRLMPYLDGNVKGVTYDGNNHWVITDDSADYYADSTCGFHQDDMEEEHYCSRCNSVCDEDELRYSEYEDTSYCDNCSDDFVWAIIDGRGNRDYVHGDNAYRNNSDDEHYTREAIEAYGLVEDYEGEYWDQQDVIETVDGDWVHANDAIEITDSDVSDTLYYTPNSIPADCIFTFTDNQVDCIYIEDSLPDEIAEDMARQRYVVDNFGLCIPETYFTFREMLLVYGVEDTYYKLKRIGFTLSQYALASMHESYQQLPMAA